MASVPRGGLEGLAVLVTGGGSGIGLGCARRFVRDGAHVTICGRGEARLAEARRALEPEVAGGSIHAVVADVTDAATQTPRPVDCTVAPTCEIYLGIGPGGSKYR